MKNPILMITLTCLMMSVSCTTTPSAPPPTKTPVPLSEIDFEGLIIQEGDLPEGLISPGLRYDAPEYKDIPEATMTFRAPLFGPGDLSGSIVVFLYEDHQKLEEAYQKIFEMKDMIRDSFPDIGEKSESKYLVEMWDSEEGGGQRNIDELVFIRCMAVIDIYFRGTEVDDLSFYAKRLDERLRPVVCR
jgi:hypothetical protein